MEFLKISLLLLLLFINKNVVYGNNIDLNIIAYAVDPNNQPYTSMINDFNRYSKKKDLNITLHLNIYTNSNSSNNVNDYGTMVESLLKKRTKKYELYIYDNAFTKIYAIYGRLFSTLCQ